MNDKVEQVLNGLKEVGGFILKKATPVIVCVVMGFTMLTGCNDQKTPEKPVDPPGQHQPENPPEEKPVDPTPEDPTWTTEAYDEFFAKMGLAKNYAYSLTENGNTDVYQIDGDKVLINDYETYLYSEGGQYYRLTYNEADGKWHKTLNEPVNVDSFIYDSMQNVFIDDYDAETDKYSVHFNGQVFEMKVTEDYVTFNRGTTTIKVEYIGQVTVEIPADRYVINDIEKPIDPNPPEEKPEEPVVEEKIYTVDAQGVRVYNSKLLGEVVKEAMNAKDENGKSLYANSTQGFGGSVDDVMVVSTEGENIEIGSVTTTSKGGKLIDVIKIAKSSVSGFPDDKASWLKSLTPEMIVAGLDLIAINYEASVEQTRQEVLKQIMSKAMEKVATIGVQSRVDATNVTPKPRYANCEVLQVFEDEDPLDGHAGLGLGNTHRKILTGVVKDKDGRHVLVHLNLATTSFKSFEDTIFNGDGVNDKYIVYKMDREFESDKNFSETIKETSVARTTAQQVALPQGKGKGE